VKKTFVAIASFLVLSAPCFAEEETFSGLVARQLAEAKVRHLNEYRQCRKNFPPKSQALLLCQQVAESAMTNAYLDVLQSELHFELQKIETSIKMLNLQNYSRY
jgi:hypothetical protein